MSNDAGPAIGGRRHALGLLVHCGLFLVVLLMPPSTFSEEEAQRLVTEQVASLRPAVLAHSPQAVAALALLMIVPLLNGM